MDPCSFRVDLMVLDWTAVAALATLAAVLVALLPLFAAWWKRPTLKVEVDNNEPFARLAIRKTTVGGTEGRYFRARVTNTGGSTADRCEARLEKVWTWAPGKNRYEPLERVDPVALHWAALEPGQFDPRPLASLAYDFVDLFRAEDPDRSEMMTFFACPQTERANVRSLTSGDYVVRFTVYADRAGPCTTYVHLVHAGQFYRSTIEEVGRAWRQARGIDE